MKQNCFFYPSRKLFTILLIKLHCFIGFSRKLLPGNLSLTGEKEFFLSKSSTELRFLLTKCLVSWRHKRSKGENIFNILYVSEI
jgi:hypothetical protein